MKFVRNQENSSFNKTTVDYIVRVCCTDNPTVFYRNFSPFTPRTVQLQTKGKRIPIPHREKQLQPSLHPAKQREIAVCLCVLITAIYRFVVCFIKFSSYLDCKLVYHLIRLSRSFHSNSLDFESSIDTVHANEHMFSFLCGTNSFCHLRQVIYSRHLKLRSDALYKWTKFTSFQHYSTVLLA